MNESKGLTEKFKQSRIGMTLDDITYFKEYYGFNLAILPEDIQQLLLIFRRDGASAAIMNLLNHLGGEG